MLLVDVSASVGHGVGSGVGASLIASVVLRIGARVEAFLARVPPPQLQQFALAPLPPWASHLLCESYQLQTLPSASTHAVPLCCLS